MAVDVGSAVGYLDLDISGFLSGLRSAQSEADSATAKIGKSLESVGGGMEKVGGFATAGISVPIVTAVTTSVKQFANLEQSIGGVTTMFKDSASKVIENAESAYRTAGVNANEYMEQVTSFSATLLQGLGGDTAKAAEYADKAIKDMSDNSNKFGTDIGLIQNAYQGFAKDNYTMLDNLKLGYGGTAGEMARLVNESGVLDGEFEATAENVKDIPFDVLIEAIHKTQENFGVMGATADEATETVSGSFQMAKASVFNFLQQLGNPGAEMDTFAQQMVDSIGIFVSNVKRVLATIWDNLPLDQWQKNLLVMAAAFGPITLAAGKVVSSVGNIMTAVSKAAPVVSQFAQGFTAAGTTLAPNVSLATKFGAALGGLAAPIAVIVAVVGTLIAAFVTLWNNNEEFRNKMIEIWTNIKETISNFCNGIVERVNALGFDFDNITQMLWSIWEGFCNLLAPIFEGVFNNVSIILDTTLNIITGILDVFIGLFTGNWQQMWDGIKSIFAAIWNGLISSLQNIVNTIINIITSWGGNMSTKAKTTATNFVNNLANVIKNLPSKIASYTKKVLSNVTTWASNMATKAKQGATKLVNNVVNTIKSLPNKVTSIGKNIVQGLWNGISGAAGWLYNKAKSFADGILSSMKRALGINSPSRLFKEQIGKFLPPGIGEGFKAALPATMQNIKDNFNKNVDKLKSKLNTLQLQSKVFAEMGDFDSNQLGTISNSFNFDYEILAMYLAEILRRAPIQPQVNVEMQDGDVIMDKERVGRKLAPVVSRVVAQGT